MYDKASEVMQLPSCCPPLLDTYQGHQGQGEGTRTAALDGGERQGLDGKYCGFSGKHPGSWWVGHCAHKWDTSREGGMGETAWCGSQEGLASDSGFTTSQPWANQPRASGLGHSEPD